MDAEHFNQAGEEIDNCYTLLKEGMKDLTKSLIPEPLHEKEIVLPLGIVSLLVKSLLKDTAAVIGSSDVSAIYDEYLGCLVSLPSDLHPTHSFKICHGLRLSLRDER